ncbi:MAG TPA: bacteriohemerythrin [Bryobacteraceae bacterium]|nr:bacteriohemerythrin [Bryobacteraceae bacterium]
MSLFAWSPQYSVGCAEIDQQHQKLFKMADDLHQAMSERRGRAVITDLLKRLIDYTVYHFATEEKRMQESGYPNYPQHRVEHVKLTDRVMAFQKKVVSGETMISIDVLQFLSDWLKHHIGESDQKLGTHLRMRPR